ncbi:hypothetical protein Tco_1424558, partial [Tanacetum coccineum]
MESHFWKIESIVTILTSLDSHINDEDIVHYALEGLPDKYNLVCGYMGYKDTFLDLKMACFLLITEEIRLKSKSFELTVDSSSASPMILMAESAPYVAVPTVQQATPGPTGPIQQSAPTTGSSGQATTLPNAFTAGTLHDPTISLWNMDT